MRRTRRGNIGRAYLGATDRIFQPTTWVGGWISPIIVTVFTLVWCFLIYGLIGDRSRDWQYGTVPYVPGESVLSLEPSPLGPVPRQVELPE